MGNDLRRFSIIFCFPTEHDDTPDSRDTTCQAVCTHTCLSTYSEDNTQQITSRGNPPPGPKGEKTKMAYQTGISRKPEKFGGSIVDDKRDELRKTLEKFEALVDKADPEQVAALEAIRSETRELERLRGVW
jgi:hypothetical protein